MEKTKHAPGPFPNVEPYVTTRGGVVILNGPFDIDQAHRIARLCRAAPDLLEACKTLVSRDEDHNCHFCSKTEWGKEKHITNCPFALAYAVIAKAEGEPDVFKYGVGDAEKSQMPKGKA